MTEFDVSSFIMSDGMLAVGPDSNLWFIQDQGGNNLGTMTTDGGGIRLFTLGNGGDHCTLGGIASGPDGNLWVGLRSTYDDAGTSEYSGIYRVTTSGVATFFPLALNHGPTSLIAGPDGNMWFIGDDDESVIYRMTTSGELTTVPVPVSCGEPGNGRQMMTIGPDGNLWFASACGICRVTMPASSVGDAGGDAD
jgi:streptogramin lyase